MVTTYPSVSFQCEPLEASGQRADVPELLAAAKWLSEAEAVLVCAGSGMSAKDHAGENVYVSEADFEAHYPYMHQYGYHTAYECMGLLGDASVPDEAKWAFWSSHYHNLRWGFEPNEGYTSLLRLVGQRNCFVHTSNVDGCFARAGWDKARIYTPQGDAAYYQCLRLCERDAVFEAAPIFEKLAASRDADRGLVETSLIPKCPRCGGPVFMNLRGGDWFLHARYNEANRSLRHWVEDVLLRRQRLVVLEVGAGFNTPSVTRFPMECITREAAPAAAALIRINPSDAEVPGDLPRAVGLATGWEALLRIEHALRSLPPEGLSDAEDRVMTGIRERSGRRAVGNTTEKQRFDWRNMLQSLLQ